jgi:hypothetical protein
MRTAAKPKPYIKEYGRMWQMHPILMHYFFRELVDLERVGKMEAIGIMAGHRRDEFYQRFRTNPITPLAKHEKDVYEAVFYQLDPKLFEAFMRIWHPNVPIRVE